MTYCAPKTHGHMGGANGKVNQGVGNGVGMVVETSDCLLVHTVLQRHAQQL